MAPLIGMPQGAEWLIILAIVVLLFGSAKLPALVKQLGKSKKIWEEEVGPEEEGRGADRGHQRACPGTDRSRPAPPAQPQAAQQPNQVNGQAPGDGLPPTTRPTDPSTTPVSMVKLGRRKEAEERRPKDDEGRMTLREHIIELRNRLLKSVLAIVLGAIARLDLLQPGRWSSCKDPFQTSVADAGQGEGPRTPSLTFTGVGDPLTFRIKISAAVRAGPGRAGLAVPAVGVHRARSAPQRAQVGDGVLRRSPPRCSSAVWRSPTGRCRRASRS